MRKIFFIFAVVLMALAAVILAGCQSEEDIAGEASAALIKPCNKMNVRTTMCQNSYIWKCTKTTFGYKWMNTKEKCATALTSEMVKCKFDNSTELQKCYSYSGYSGKYGCEGINGCGPISVTGVNGTKVKWNSTCGRYGANYSITTIDGLDEDVSFPCAIPTSATQT